MRCTCVILQKDNLLNHPSQLILTMLCWLLSVFAVGPVRVWRGGADAKGIVCRIHHNEPWLRRPHRAARQSKGMILSNVWLIFFLILFPLLCGINVTLPCSTVVHVISGQSLLFDIIPHSIQQTSVRPSSLPSHLYFHFHRLLPIWCCSLLIICPYHLNLLSWTFFEISPNFVVPLIV